MICMNYDHNKKFGLLKFHSGYGKFNLNSPKGYSLKIINAQTDVRQRRDNSNVSFTSGPRGAPYGRGPMILYASNIIFSFKILKFV